MDIKKQISNWKLALIHYLIAGVGVVLVIRFILVLILALIASTFGSLDFFESVAGKYDLSFLVFWVVLNAFPLWIGVLLSAKILRNKYIIGDKNKVINSSLIYFVVLSPIFSGLLVFISFFLEVLLKSAAFLLCGANVIYSFLATYLDSSFPRMYGVVGFCVLLILFYVLSKKYFSDIKILDSIKNIVKPEEKKNYKTITNLLVIVFFLGVTYYILGLIFAPLPSYEVAHDSRIISAIGQSRTIMTYTYRDEANYDRFNCNHPDMIMLCQEIDENHKPIDNTEPIIAHDAINNSQAVCIYSPLVKKKNYWYCADNSGRAGYTTINPGNTGYCVEGESAVCPPLEEM